MKKLIVVPILCGLLLGCDNKAEQTQFEAASKNVLSAADPLMEFNKFDAQAGDYGKECGERVSEMIFGVSSSRRAACNERLSIEKKIVMASIDKGSQSALVFLFDVNPKFPPVYDIDLPDGYVKKQRERLLELARTLPPKKENKDIFILAGNYLQYGNKVTQDSLAAIDAYKKAWQSGDESAAENISEIYRFLGDIPRTYFWKIRAKSIPENSEGVSKLTPEEKVLIQRKAADATLADL
ncbi:hypothetical protein ACLF4E_004215 [Cronobacter malonaticus]|uniref:hypothetical protein n=2 Tax=Cronobacter sakazakii TaxID=28141 RepID=UPI00084E2581|nr:hypothetical protein [Cronobacter sakazakii]EAV5731203.1 hypothetical protein [Salmonella enterica]EDC9289981.1 hypothetical protein [Salmonella enterica subsp. enterica serovar Enteritidis]EDT3546926.1 hypothetical protein [Salmonella enterica subsp. enterica serovar Thompson]HBB0519922.1 hypothetical protein [Escherichia coli]EAX8453258.1 hypothetical protein [Salmonella enterica]